MTEAEARYIKRLPETLRRAREKVRAYERAALRYRMHDLLTDSKFTNRAWDEAIDEGRARTGYPDLTWWRP